MGQEGELGLEQSFVSSPPASPSCIENPFIFTLNCPLQASGQLLNKNCNRPCLIPTLIELISTLIMYAIPARGTSYPILIFGVIYVIICNVIVLLPQNCRFVICILIYRKE